MRSTRQRLALVLVILPVAATAFLQYLRHTAPLPILDTWLGSVLVVAAVLVGSLLLTHVLFEAFERRRRSLLQLAAKLTELSAVAPEGARGEEAILRAILTQALRSLRANAGAVYLLDRSEQALRLVAREGDAAAASLPGRLATTSVALAETLASGEVRVLDSPAELGPLAHPGHTLGLVPLRSRDQTLGLMILAARRSSDLGENQDILSVLGWQVGVTVDNQRLLQETLQLLEQSRSVAVLEERDRLAREMHDSLAQIVGLLGMKGRVVVELLRRGDGAGATREAADIAETADSAYADVREAILGLRRSATPRDLVDNLRDYLRQFSRQSGVHATLEVEPGAVGCLARSTETQVIRVIQEALTNVRKHARATAAVVRFEADGRWTKVIVEDDGQGFDASSVAPTPWHGYGLRTMRERIEGVGGTLVVESAPGAGTRIIARLPSSSDDSEGTIAASDVRRAGEASSHLSGSGPPGSGLRAMGPLAFGTQDPAHAIGPPSPG